MHGNIKIKKKKKDKWSWSAFSTLDSKGKFFSLPNYTSHTSIRLSEELNSLEFMFSARMFVQLMSHRETSTKAVTKSKEQSTP